MSVPQAEMSTAGVIIAESRLRSAATYATEDSRESYFPMMAWMAQFTSVITGPPSYIPTELWPDERPDHRIDVYSFPAVIFRALAGQPPFWAPSTTKGASFRIVAAVKPFSSAAE